MFSSSFMRSTLYFMFPPPLSPDPGPRLCPLTLPTLSDIIMAGLYYPAALLQKSPHICPYSGIPPHQILARLAARGTHILQYHPQFPWQANDIACPVLSFLCIAFPLSSLAGSRAPALPLLLEGAPGAVAPGHDGLDDCSVVHTYDGTKIRS